MYCKRERERYIIKTTKFCDVYFNLNFVDTETQETDTSMDTSQAKNDDKQQKTPGPKVCQVEATFAEIKIFGGGGGGA